MMPVTSKRVKLVTVRTTQSKLLVASSTGPLSGTGQARPRYASKPNPTAINAALAGCPLPRHGPRDSDSEVPRDGNIAVTVIFRSVTIAQTAGEAGPGMRHVPGGHEKRAPSDAWQWAAATWAHAHGPDRPLEFTVPGAA
jgi:hypothetical protein